MNSGPAIVVFAVCGLALNACVGTDRAPRASDSGSGTLGGSTAAQTDDGPAEIVVDQEAIMQRAFNYQTELVKVNDVADPGTHGDADLVNYFVSGENLVRFKMIDPTLTDQTVRYVEGAMFVKEHVDADAAVTGFTVMYKGPPGYNPEASDWFWGRVLDGELTHQGKVEFCADCHEDVESTDYVFGLRFDNHAE